ncbi:MAG: polyprenol monophosphomannose synthase [Candidatus Paceibacterota bacterium]
MKVAVVLPTYNEKENAGVIIPEIFRVLPECTVFVVDDNSPDGTAAFTESLKTKFPNLRLVKRQNKEGLGKAYIYAFKEILKNFNFDIFITMDADLSHSPKYLPEIIAKAETNDVVVGSRYVKGGQTVGWELWRRILSFGGNFYCKMILGMPVFDATAGFIAIKTDFIKKVDFEKFDLSGYAFLIELKYTLYKLGAKFFEVPIVFKNRIGGESKISNHIISEGVLAPWKMLFKK